MEAGREALLAVMHELLPETLKGKRDRALLAALLGYGLRRPREVNPKGIVSVISGSPNPGDGVAFPPESTRNGLRT